MTTPILDDYDAIVATAQDYIDGVNEHDVKKFKRAFDEDAWIFYVNEEGQLLKRQLTDEIFEQWANPNSEPVKLRILSVLQSGDAACVNLACGTEYFDFHNMVRVDGVWKITNKTASHKLR